MVQKQAQKPFDATVILESRPLLLERFAVLRILGEGAAGAVYLVEDRQNKNKQVALKVLIDKEAFDEHTYQRFKSEWEVTQNLRHPNIVEAYELIELNDAIAFTMEFVPGQDLRKILDQGLIEFAKIDLIISQLLSALSYLHHNGVFHRDIKLENILITSNGHLKLSDFGLIKQDNQQKLTRTGILLGTAQYMAPEYIMRSQYTAQSDIFSVGVILYELLQSKRWLADKQGNEVITHLIQHNFEFPEIKTREIPEKYKYILANCLNTKASKRFRNAEEMKDLVSKPIDDQFWININQEQNFEQTKALKIKKVDVISNRNYINKHSLSAMALIVIFLVTGLAAFWGMGYNVPINMPIGSYNGKIKIHSESLEFKASLQVGSSGAVLLSTTPFCRNGFLNFKNSSLTCDNNSYNVSYNELKNKTANSTNRNLKQNNKFKLTISNWYSTLAEFESN
jgi:serine/threonine protein kinase